MSYARQEYSAVKLENGTVATEHWNAYSHNQDTPLRTRPRGHAPQDTPPAATCGTFHIAQVQFKASQN